MMAQRLFVAFAGLAGACGVSASAAAYHVGIPQLDAAARILLAHAPVFAVVAALIGRTGWPARALTLVGTAFALGLLLFCGDLLARFWGGWTLFPYAAPTGGTILILAWIWFGLSAFLIRKQPHAGER